jgi:DNA-binding response OmpR family regulator
MLSSQRVLIIEEMPLIALDIQRAVESAHAADAAFARDFKEAAGLAARFGEFDLAIVNPPAPGSAEMETAAQLAAACPALVVCSASSTDLAGTALAAAEMVAKPFSDDALLAACQRAMERRLHPTA